MRGRKKKAISIPKLKSCVKYFSINIPFEENTIELKIELYHDEDVLKVNKQLTEVLQELISQC